MMLAQRRTPTTTRRPRPVAPPAVAAADAADAVAELQRLRATHANALAFARHLEQRIAALETARLSPEPPDAA